MTFFNKTIFKKNITLYWPIWGIYTFVLLCSMPGLLWLEFQSYYFMGLTKTQKISSLYSVLEATGLHIWLIAITATVSGMALFHYMYNTKSAYMIHALPTNRKELFATNVLSGLTFLAGPQVLAFVITMLLCLSEGITCVEYVAMWLLLMLVTDVIAFSIVTVCAMLTGQMLALPFYIIAVNSLSWIVGGLMDIMSSIYSYGVDSNIAALSSHIVKWLSPLVCYLTEVRMTTSIWTEEDNGMQLHGIPCILIYLVAAIVLYGIAYWLYQKRHIEQAGNLVAIKALKRVFCYLVGIFGGLYGAVIVTFIFEMFGFHILKSFVFVLVMLIIGVMAYFFADMLVKKTFRVFKRENWISAGICAIVVLGCFGGLCGYAEWVQNRVPKSSEIEYVVTSLDHRMEYSGENSQWVVDIHQEIVDNLSYLEKMDETDAYPYTQEETINFSYYLKDGTYMSRYYVVPEDNGIGESFIDTYIEREHDVEPFLSNLTTSVYYDKLEEFSYAFLSYSTYEEKTADGYVGVNAYDKNILDEEKIESLYQAVLADAEAGNLMKYNSGYICNEHVRTYYSELELHYVTFKAKDPVGDRTFDFTIFFGSDCENILNAIVNLGYVKGTEFFYWREVAAPDANYENTLESLICEEYSRVTKFYCGSLGYKRTLEGLANFASFELNEKQCEALYNVIINEFKNGNLRYYCEGEHEQMLYLSIVFMNPSDAQPYLINIPFGPGCEYIIKELVAQGIVQSDSELEWKDSNALEEVITNPDDMEDPSWIAQRDWIVSYMENWDDWKIVEGCMTHLTDEINYMTVYFGPNEAEDVYFAVVDDTISGLYKDYFYQREIAEYQLQLKLLNKNTEQQEYIGIKFGKKCLYLMKVLEELGLD